MLETLQAILKGQKVEINEYDYRSNAVCPDKKLIIYPADVVLFEGILVFYFPEIRDLFHMKLFVDTDSDTRLARRGEHLLGEMKRNFNMSINVYKDAAKKTQCEVSYIQK